MYKKKQLTRYSGWSIRAKPKQKFFIYRQWKEIVPSRASRPALGPTSLSLLSRTMSMEVKGPDAWS